MLNENKISNHFYSKVLGARKSTLNVSTYHIEVDVHLYLYIQQQVSKIGQTPGFKLEHRFNDTLVCYPWRRYNVRLRTSMYCSQPRLFTVQVHQTRRSSCSCQIKPRKQQVVLKVTISLTFCGDLPFTFCAIKTRNKGDKGRKTETSLACSISL